MGKNIESLSVPITEGTNAEHILYRVKRGSTVNVHPDAGLLGREIVLYTNYPEEGKVIFIMVNKEKMNNLNFYWILQAKNLSARNIEFWIGF